MHRRTLHLTGTTTTSRCIAAPCRRLELRALSTSDEQRTYASEKQKGDKASYYGRGKRRLSPEMQMMKDTFMLINKATKKNTDRSGWRGINKRRSEETRLKADIRVAGWGVRALGESHREKLVQVENLETGHGGIANQPAQLPSLMKQAYDASEGQEHEQDLVAITYELGMFVELRRNEISTHGVIVGERSAAGRLFYPCLMSSGEIWTPNVNDIYFSLPPIAPSDLARRCGTDPIATNEGQQNARVQMLRRIRLVEKALENKYHVVSVNAHDLYEKLRHPDPHQWGETTVGEVTKTLKLQGLISEFAVHRFLMNNPINFVAEPGYRASQKFKVVPEAHVKDLEAVEAWMRKEDGPLTKFVPEAHVNDPEAVEAWISPLTKFAQKAWRIVVANREKLRLGFAGAPSWRRAHHAWDANDRTILRVLINALRFQRSTQSDPYVIFVSAILKRLDLESPVVKDHELQATLVELGILAPWQDLVVIQPHLDLDLEPEHKSKRAKKQNELVQRGFKMIKQAATNRPTTQAKNRLGPEDFHPSDPLEEVRHDFGDMKIYVVDDFNAQELDDGISIERVPLEPGSMWIHVHIADMASVIHPRHVFAIEASKRQETMYLHNAFPLFPPSLTHSPTHGLSLGSRGKGGGPLRVLTFSCKVDADAKILDYKIRAGLVRNIKTIDYDSVDRALGLPSHAHYPFGRPSSTTDTETASLSEEEIQDFRDLLAFADAATSQRVKNGTFAIDHALGKVQLGSLPERMPTWPTLKPSEFSGFPSMNYIVQRTSDMERGSRSVIAEAAKLACRVTSRFGLEWNLPLLRRHAPPFVPNNPTDLCKMMVARTSNGYAEPHIAAKYISFSPPSTYTLLPKEHFHLGVPDGEGYVRSTSPLRRYSDLVVHWQLHHALLGGRAEFSTPPFSADDLEKYMAKLTGHESRQKGLRFHHQRYWQTMFIHRWVEGIRLGHIDPDKVVGGKNPMDELYARTQLLPRVNPQLRYEAPVTLPDIGARGILLLPDRTLDVEIGTEFNVRLKEVKLGVRPMMTFEVKE
ncbi:hypothetical protein F5887DRAFT_947631 [Amanita rubescens]|nr:hypothetical protein F5887DRAFT_947631 [Amanita rubescens]